MLMSIFFIYILVCVHFYVETSCNLLLLKIKQISYSLVSKTSSHEQMLDTKTLINIINRFIMKILFVFYLKFTNVDK